MIHHDRLIERYLVSSIVHAPTLLDLPAVQALPASDLLDWIAYRVFALVRNVTSRFAIGPEVITRAYEAQQLEAQDGDRLGHKHHRELDELLALAARRPVSAAAAPRLVAIVRRDAARRRRDRAILLGPERLEELLIDAMLESVAHLPPGRPERVRRAA